MQVQQNDQWISVHNNQWIQSFQYQKTKFDLALKKIIQSSYLFKWMSVDILSIGIKNHNLEICEVSEWTDLLVEWSKKCECFYLLLKWEISVYKWNKKLANLPTMWVVGEIWFMNPNLWRTATVKCETDCYVVKLGRWFINWLSNEDKMIFFQNLFMETVQKLIWLNEQLSHLDSDNVIGNQATVNEIISKVREWIVANI